MPLPHPVRWTALALVLFAVAAGLAALNVVRRPAVAPPEQAGELVYPALDPAALDLTAAAVLAVLGFVATRRALFGWLARRPGPVEVVDFDGVGTANVAGTAEPGARAIEPGQVLADFRQTLTAMSITTPLSIPTAPQQVEFLDDVQKVAEAKTTFAGVISVLRALFRVQYAYSVSAQLRTRAGVEPFGITLHIVSRPGNRGEVATLWAEDWAVLAERAGHWVGAYILPRSRLSRRPPWTAWHGLEMPYALFHHSQLARRCVADKRYEEAMSHFHQALKLDPQNPYLRIELAQVMEQLGLHMDALAAYADAVAVEAWFDRRLWRRLRGLLDDESSGGPPSRLRRGANGRQGLLIARYRLVGRLASATWLTTQWQRTDPDRGPERNMRRSEERRALRDRLTVWLSRYYAFYAAELGVDPEHTPFEQIADDGALMRHFLQFVGCAEAMHLIHDYRWFGGRRRPGMPVSQTALSLLEPWAKLLLQFAASEVPRASWDRLGCPGPASRLTWKPEVGKIEAAIRYRLRRKPPFTREWQEYYNAACNIAVALTTGAAGSMLGPDDRRKIALRAVRHLERAISSTDSGFVATYAQWLSTGDEDLDHLRSTPEFVDFLNRYLPNNELRVPRPRQLVRLIISQHTALLLRQFALNRADFFAGNGSATPLEPHRLLEELRRERAARQVALEFVADDRDWRRRLRLIEAGAEFGNRHSLPPFRSSLPSFQDDPAAHAYTAAWKERRRTTSESEADENAFAQEHFDRYIVRREVCLDALYQILSNATRDDRRRHRDEFLRNDSLQLWRQVTTELDRGLGAQPAGAAPTQL